MPDRHNHDEDSTDARPEGTGYGATSARRSTWSCAGPATCRPWCHDGLESPWWDVRSLAAAGGRESRQRA